MPYSISSCRNDTALNRYGPGPFNRIVLSTGLIYHHSQLLNEIQEALFSAPLRPVMLREGLSCSASGCGCSCSANQPRKARGTVGQALRNDKPAGMRAIIPFTYRIPLHQVAKSLKDFRLDTTPVGTSPNEDPGSGVAASKHEIAGQLAVNQIDKPIPTGSAERPGSRYHLGQL